MAITTPVLSLTIPAHNDSGASWEPAIDNNFTLIDTAIGANTTDISTEVTNRTNADALLLPIIDAANTYAPLPSVQAPGMVLAGQSSGLAAYSFWRINVLASSAPSFCSLATLELRSVIGGPSIAVGGTPTVKNVYQSTPATWGPQMLFDGNAATFWTNASGGASWMQYQFIQPQLIVEIYMVGRTGTRTQDPVTFDILASNDGITWTTIRSFVGLTWVQTGQPTQTLATSPAVPALPTFRKLTAGDIPSSVMAPYAPINSPTFTGIVGVSAVLMDTTTTSWIGASNNSPWLAYAFNGSNWAWEANAGDVVMRNMTGKLIFTANPSLSAQMIISQTGIKFSSPISANELTITQLTTPNNSTFSTGTTTGFLIPGTYYYRISALDSIGTTLASIEKSIVVPAGTNTNITVVSCSAVVGAYSYNVYGRTIGAELYIANVIPVGTNTMQFVDNGSITPAGALPTVNTTGVMKSANINMPLVTPLSSTDTGNVGDIHYDANYIYVCTATNTWKRATLVVF